MHRKDELSVSHHVLLSGSRVIVSPRARDRVIDLLHSTHPGVNRIKSLAQSCLMAWHGRRDRGAGERLSCLSREFEFTSKSSLAPTGMV